MAKCYQLTLTVEQLLAQSRKITGINIVDTAAIEPLTNLVNSFNNDSCLHEEGVKGTEDKLIRLLCNRLRMQRDFTNHPEIREQQVKAPVFLIGMGRTGSTKTQKLLASSGDFNPMAFWQSYNPSLYTGSRNELPEQRIADAETFIKWFDGISPEAKYAHAFESHETDEESWALEHCLITPLPLGYTDLSGYLQWLGSQDMTQQFRFLKDVLKYLQWQGYGSETKPWVLKSPLYYGMEKELLQVFPDARLIMTHRDPGAVIPSSIRLIETYHKPYTDKPVVYKNLVPGFALQMQAHLKNRQELKELKILDIHYQELINNIETVIEDIYSFAKMALSDGARQKMLAWENANPKNKKGTFNYSLSDYGYIKDEIDAMFSEYVDLLDKLVMETTA